MSLKRHILALGAFAGIATLAMCWLLLVLPDHMPNHIVTDYYHFHWNYWWVRFALSNGLSVYQTNYVMFPFTSNLALHTLTLSWFPVWAVFEPLLGTMSAMALVFFTGFTLTGYVFFLFLRAQGVSSGLALTGAAMLEVSSLMYTALFLYDVNLVGWFWLPALMLIWQHMSRAALAATPEAGPSRGPTRVWHRNRSSLLSIVALALCSWGMILTDLQYPILAAFIVVPFAVKTLWQMPGWNSRFRLLAHGVLAGLAAVVLLWFFGPLPYLIAFERTGLVATPAERATAIRFPEGFVGLFDPTKGTSLGLILLPALVLTLIISLRRPVVHSRHWFWLALVPAPLVLSAGASITIADTRITLPYQWLYDFLGGLFRFPERFAPVILMVALTFILLTWTPILRGRVARIMVPTFALLLIVFDSRILVPMVLQPVPPRYEFYEEMGKEPYDYVVVEVPNGARSGEVIVGSDEQAALQYYGLTHGKRMINGLISRVNVGHFWYLRTDDPLLSWLGQRRQLEPDVVEEQLRKRIYDWPIGYLVIHRDLIWSDGPTIQEILGYFNSLPDLLCPVWIEGPAVVYRTAWHPAGCPPGTPPEIAPGEYLVDIGEANDASTIGWGWHWPEQVGGLSVRWTGQYPQTLLYVNLPPGPYQLSLRAQSFYRDRTLEIQVNDSSVGKAIVPESGLVELTFDIPAEVLGSGQHVTIRLVYDGTDTPASAGLAASDRSLAVMVDWLKFKLNVGGQ